VNILLTTRCNKNCSFCFANQAMREKPAQDMTLENFRSLIRLAKTDQINPTVKLLGGEPTMHPDFPQILTILRQEGAHACLISNLLYGSDTVRDSLRQAIADKVIDGCLSNAAELGTEAKMRLFARNYQDLQAAFAQYNPGQFVAAGITLSRHKTAAEETAYIEYLSQNIEIRRLRLSLDFQAENKIDKFFVNNKEYGNKVQEIIYKCLDLRVSFSWDCKIYPCLFDAKVFQKDVLGFTPHVRSVCPADGAPFDVFPDMSYVHCYPARALSGQNILKFKRLSEAADEITFLKNTLQTIHKDFLPEECRECHYYQSGICDSLCLGCQELKASFLQYV
jgi:organic radical activating enzyme